MENIINKKWLLFCFAMLLVKLSYSESKDPISLRFGNIDDFKTKYYEDNREISDIEFKQTLSRNLEAYNTFKKGNTMRWTGRGLSIVSGLGALYFANKASRAPLGEENYMPVILSTMAMLTGQMIKLGGKNKMGVGVGNFNNTPVDKANRFTINLTAGGPPYGLASTGTPRSESFKTFGIGAEIHLHKHWFGFLDGYMQNDDDIYWMSSGIFRRESSGQTLVTGIGLQYNFFKNFEVQGKFGVGGSNIATITYLNDKVFKKTEREIQMAGLLGLNVRYRVRNHFSFGANLNISENTPTYNLFVSASI